MTLRELSGLYWLNCEIDQTNRVIGSLRTRLAEEEERLCDLKNRAGGISINYDGMPHAPGGKGPTESYATRIVDTESMIELLKHQIAETIKKLEGSRIKAAEKRNELLNYIDGIADPALRVVLRARFVECLPWSGVSSVTGKSSEACRKMVYRHAG